MTTTTTTTTTSQSIFVTLDSLSTTTSVPGQTPKQQPMTLPREAFPTSEEFENAEELLAWAEDAGITQAVLQKGIQKHLVDIRACFKACKKDDTWSIKYGQVNVDDYDWEVQTRPNSTPDIASAKLDAGKEMAQAMVDAGVSPDMLITSLTPVYGEEVAEVIIDSIIR